MPQSIARVLIHIVYSTKHRKPFLRNEGVRDELYRYMATSLKTLESPAIIINGTADHVHILCRLSRNYAIKTLVGKSKASCSKWIKEKGPEYQVFAWQAGYGAFSVSQSQAATVTQYIRDQEKHHERKSYQDEFRALCALHEVDLDEQYAWD